MKKTIIKIFLVTALFSASVAKAQFSHKWQVGVSGGAALPVSTYKTIPGHVNTGLFAGLTADRFFKCGPWGLGLDMRFITNKVASNTYAFTFGNGDIYIPAGSNNGTTFQHTGISLGPVYRKKISSRFELDATIKGGVLYSNYPDFRTNLRWGTPLPVNVTLHEWTNNATNNVKQWMANGSISVNYKIAPVCKVFLKADYMQTIGDNFFGNNNTQYRYQARPVNNALTATSLITGWFGGATPYLNYYNAAPFIVQKQTEIKTVNVSMGVKFSFGNCAGKKTKAAKVAALKNTLVSVKDKLTGLPLSNVKVTIKKMDGTVAATGFTNENGQYAVPLQADDYTVEGIKNNIASSTDKIEKNEFSLSSDVLSEIEHDDPRFTLAGETVDATTAATIAGINTTLTNMTTAEAYNQSSGSNGGFQYQLQANTEYSLVASQRGIFSNVETVSTKGLNRSQTLYVKLKMGVKDLSSGASFTVNNIYYDLDKATVRDDAATALNNLVRVLKLNPDLKIELSAHTDSRGDDSYNMNLSQKRAEAVVDYLVTKGINASRLTAKGYGETKPVNGCTNGVNCSEAEFQKNRRTEIKVLSN